jgi:hypothetical protein
MGCDRTVGVPEHQGSIDDLVAKLVCTNHVKDPFSGTVPESRAQVKHAASFMPHVRYLCPSSPHGKTLSSALPSMAHAAQRSPVPVLAPAQPGLTQGCRPSDRAFGAAGCWPLLACWAGGPSREWSSRRLAYYFPSHLLRPRPCPASPPVAIAAPTRSPNTPTQRMRRSWTGRPSSSRGKCPPTANGVVDPSSTQLLTPTPAASS